MSIFSLPGNEASAGTLTLIASCRHPGLADQSRGWKCQRLRRDGDSVFIRFSKVFSKMRKEEASTRDTLTAGPIAAKSPDAASFANKPRPSCCFLLPGLNCWLQPRCAVVILIRSSPIEASR